jgi:hypothetical protein
VTTRERPTAAIRRVDVSAPESDSSAARTQLEKAETVLFRAYGQLLSGQRGVFRVTDMRVESCQCGGTLTLEAGADVQAAVEAHNRTARHTAWRAWRDAS